MNNFNLTFLNTRITLKGITPQETINYGIFISQSRYFGRFYTNMIRMSLYSRRYGQISLTTDYRRRVEGTITLGRDVAFNVRRGRRITPGGIIPREALPYKFFFMKLDNRNYFSTWKAIPLILLFGKLLNHIETKGMNPLMVRITINVTGTLTPQNDRDGPSAGNFTFTIPTLSFTGRSFSSTNWGQSSEIYFHLMIGILNNMNNGTFLILSGYGEDLVDIEKSPFFEFDIISFRITPLRVGTLKGENIMSDFFYNCLMKDTTSFLKFTKKMAKEKLDYYFTNTKNRCVATSMHYATFLNMKDLDKSLKSTEGRNRAKGRILSLHSKIINKLYNYDNVTNFNTTNEFVLAQDIVRLMNSLKTYSGFIFRWNKANIIFYFLNTSPMSTLYSKKKLIQDPNSNVFIKILILNNVHAVPLIYNEDFKKSRYILENFLKWVLIPKVALKKKTTRLSNDKGTIVLKIEEFDPKNRKPNHTGIFYFDLETFNDSNRKIESLEKKILISNNSEAANIRREIIKIRERRAVHLNIGYTTPISSQVLIDEKLFPESERVQIFYDMNRPSRIATNCIGSMFKSLTRTSYINDKGKRLSILKRNNIFYAHNSGGFDAYHIWIWLMDMMIYKNSDRRSHSYVASYVNSSLIYRNSKIVSFSFKIILLKPVKRTYVIKIKDTIQFAQGSLLGLGSMLNFPEAKDKDLLVYEELNGYESLQDPEFFEKMDKYSKNDVVLLRKVFNYFIEQFKKENGVDIRNFSTFSSVTNHLLYGKYYPDDEERYTPPILLEDKYRKHYFGGNTQAFIKGVFEGPNEFYKNFFLERLAQLENMEKQTELIYHKGVGFTVKELSDFIKGIMNSEYSYIDFTSLYPTATEFLIKMENPERIAVGLPEGIGVEHKIKEILPDLSFESDSLEKIISRVEKLNYFLIEIEYKHVDNPVIYRQFFPLFPQKKDGANVFPYVLNHFEQTLISKEIFIDILKNGLYGMVFKFGKKLIMFPVVTHSYYDIIKEFFQKKANVDKAKSDISKRLKEELDEDTRKKLEARFALYSVMRMLYKLTINGTYGSKAIKIHDSLAVTVRHDEKGILTETLQSLLSAKVHEYESEGESLKIILSKTYLKTKKKNLFHAIIITQRSRYALFCTQQKINKELNALLNVPIDRYFINFCIYCDTDSIISFGGLWFLEKLFMAKDNVFNKGSLGLGGLTDETTMDKGFKDHALYIVGPKIYGYKDSYGWHMKAKGFNQRTKFTKKYTQKITLDLTHPFTLKKETKKQQNVLRLTLPYSNNYIKKYKTKTYNITPIEFKKIALNKYKALVVDTFNFSKGIELASKKDGGYFMVEKTIKLMMENTKGKPYSLEEYESFMEGNRLFYRIRPLILFMDMDGTKKFT